MFLNGNMKDPVNSLCIIKKRITENCKKQTFSSVVWIRETSCRYNGSFTVAPVCCVPQRELRHGTSNAPAFPAWFERKDRSRASSEAGAGVTPQITTSCSVIFSFTASLCLFLRPALPCVDSLAGAPLPALTLCNQI